MTTGLTRNFMNALQRAERTGDLEELLALFAADAEALNLGRKEPARGRDGLKRFWLEYLEAFQDISSEFTHVLEGDGGSVLEWISRGTLPNGEPVEYRGVSVLEIDRDKVRRFRTYYDSATFLPEGAKSG